MIKQYITFNSFLDSFSDTYKNNFSYNGKKALFEYLEDFSEDIGEDLELDTVALCCEFSEYDNLEELQANYNDIDSFKDLEDKTTVIYIYDLNGIKQDNFIIQQY